MASAASDLTRPLGSFERAAARFDRDTPFNAAVSLTLSGGIDDTRAHEALTAMVLSHPIMTMATSRGSLVAAARAEPEFAESDGDEAALARAVDDLLNDRPHARAGAPVRARLVRGQGTSSLVICAPHYLVDAVSLAQLLFGALAAVPVRGERRPLTPAPDTHFPQAFKGWRGTAAAARYALRQGADEIAARRDRKGGRDSAIPKRGLTRHGVLTIAPDQLAQLSKACRRHGATLTGALSAAVSRVFVSRLMHRDRGLVRLMSFCDLRRRIAPRLTSDELGAALAITRHLIALEAGADWPAATAISRDIDAGTKRGDPFCASRLAPSMMRIAFATRALRMADVAVSLPVLAFPKAEWVSRIHDFRGYVSVTPLAPPLSVIAAVSRAGLSLSFMYLDSEFDAGTMAELGAETARLLARMAEA